MFD
ncbi:hypothetical protein VCCP1040_1060, partial [Vibrio cholerae CP1040(13)]|jgi:hypothetical protein